MLGKARSKKNQKSARIWEEKLENLNPDDFGEVFSTYQQAVSKGTFTKNFGYDAIFVDEAQDIDSTNEAWITLLWKDSQSQMRKLWIFGDEGQNFTRFRGNSSIL